MPRPHTVSEIAIDLGEARWDSEETPESPSSLRLGRLLTAIGVALSTLLAVAGAAPSSSLVLREPAWVIPPGLTDAFSLGQDVAVLADGEKVTGRDLRTGRELWQLRMAGGIVLLEGVRAGVVSLSVSDRSDGGGTESSILFVDERTGDIISEFSVSLEDGGPPAPVGVSPDGTVIVLHRQMLDEADCEEACVQLIGVQKRTGTKLWWYEPREHRKLFYSIVDDRLGTIVATSHAGTVELIDALSGRVTPLADIHVDDRAGVMLTGNLLVVAAPSGPEVTVTAYDIDSGKPAWHSTVDVMPTTDPYAYLQPCGDDVCVLSPGSWAVLDGGTGRVKLDGRESHVEWLDSGRVVVERQLSGGVFASAVSLIDPSTGKVIREIDNAQLMATGPDDLALIGRIGLAGMDLLLVSGTGQVRHLSTLPGREHGCSIQSSVLICYDRSTGESRIWPLPEPP